MLLDAENGLVALSKTQTPGVPQGHKFKILIQVTIGAIDNNTTRLLVTQDIEWLGWSMLSSVITPKAQQGVTTSWAGKVEAANAVAEKVRFVGLLCCVCVAGSRWHWS